MLGDTVNHIFISHSSKDSHWVLWLSEQVEAAGIRPYLAEHDVKPGLNLAEKVKAQIAASEALIVLLTSNSATAPYVHQEVGYALASNKLVIPLVHPEIKSESLAMLQGAEYISFDFDAPDEGTERLLGSLRDLVRRREQHDREQREREQLILLMVGALIVLALASGAGQS